MTKHTSNTSPITGGKPPLRDRVSTIYSGAGKMPLLYLLLGIAVFGTFFPALNNDFVNYDDIMYVAENPQVQAGLTGESFRWAFQTTTASNWHPLTWLSHMLDCQLYGLHPWGHHLTNVMLHTVNSLLLFLVLRRMTGATWRSWWVALLFGLHPLHVQSVAWVAERKDVLSTLFWLLALWSYTRYTEAAKIHPGRARSAYAITLLLFAGGLMSKPMIVTLPFVLLLLDYWPLGRVTGDKWQVKNWKKLLVEKTPFILLSAVASAVTLIAQKAGGAMTSLERLPLLGRIENAVVTYGQYLGKMFWPENLAVLYPLLRAWPVWMVIWSSFLLLGVTILVMALRQRRPYLPLGWFWFIGTLVPVIGLVQVGEQSMADRYMYVPMIGVLILLVWGSYELSNRWRYGIATLTSIGMVAAITCALITWQEIGYWKNSETLFQRDLAVVEATPTAHYKLGVALNKKGDRDGAAYHFQEILKLKPDDYHAFFALGVIANDNGQLDNAIGHFQAVLKLKPDYAEAHYNLGFALSRKGQMDIAMKEYQEALRFNSDYFEARNSLGVALARSGQLDAAIVEFQAARELKPNDLGTLYNLGVAYNGKGRLDEAIALFQKVIELQPDNADAHNNLGLAFSRKSQLPEAVKQFQAALQLNPNHIKAQKNLTVALQAMGSLPATRPNP